MSQAKIFGSTDGVRGKANFPPLDTETVMHLGKALAEYLKKHVEINPNRPYRVIIGKDTRRSGYLIEQSLTAGFLSRGVDVVSVGPIPTPAISHLVRSFALDLGVMITASHNPYLDNGIKVFTARGTKLTIAEQDEVEKIYFEKDFPGTDTIGRAKRIEDVSGRYIEFLKSTVKSISLKGFTIVIDCANGAGYKAAPEVFKELGAKVITIGVNPDGYNINKDCGALHPEKLAKTILKEKADLGIALDGDGDRLIMVDETGKVIDGDYLMTLVAKYLKSKNRLRNDAIAVTQYSNLAIVKELRKYKIKVFNDIENSDKAVLEKCKQENLIFGGEQSGHYIFLKYSIAGDGTLSALQVLRIMKDTGKKLSELAFTFEKYPQKLFNIKVNKKIPLEDLEAFQKIQEKWLKKFGKNGRIFSRYSGTENLLRIMVEAQDAKDMKNAGKELSEVAERELR
ncbi:MAG: phosphoglucosamine mutase [bacterium]